MEWWGWVAWAFAILTGGYAAWRSWRTDRRLKVLGKKWEWTPDTKEQMLYLLQNWMPRTAYDVRVEGPSGHIVMPQPEAVSIDIGPTEGWSFLVIITYTHDTGPMSVSWSKKPGPNARRFMWRGHLPASIAPGPFG